MPYEIKSRCSACGQGDVFLIGNWPEHLGVYACNKCQKLVNVPLNTGECPGCGDRPEFEDYFDHSRSIGYFDKPWGEPFLPGPECPKCHGAALHFDNKAHLNMGVLGRNPEKPWLGKVYREKLIFLTAIIPVLSEFRLDPNRILEYYNIDVPPESSPRLRQFVSLPIMLDIRTHLVTVQMINPSLFESLQK